MGRLRYRTALYEGFRFLSDRPLSAVTAEVVCTRIKGVDMQVRRELVDVLFTQPYCRIQNVVDAGIAKRETAARSNLAVIAP